MAAEALAVLAACCLLLRIRPYRALARRLPMGDRPAPHAVSRAVAAAVRRAAALLGPDLCLREAMAGRIMLARRGYASTIRLGVRQAADGGLRAHAWLVSGDYVVTGGAGGLNGLTPLDPPAPPASPDAASPVPPVSAPRDIAVPIPAAPGGGA